MKTPYVITRILALFLSLALVAPSSLGVYAEPGRSALRVENGGLEEKNRTTSEIEKSLRRSPSRQSSVGIRSAGLEEGMQELRQLRSSVEDLPTFSIMTASLWGTLDFLLNSTISHGLVGQASNEYGEIKKWLETEYPDLRSPVLLELLISSEQTSILSFRIKTSMGLYVLAVQTQDTRAGGSEWARVSLPELEQSQSYQLEEIVTGENFPWDPPYHYIGSYLRGETDRFGDSRGQERWGIKPGDRKGDFQFFRVSVVDGVSHSLQWKDLLSPAVKSSSSSLTFSRSADDKRHTLIKDSGMAADVITGKPFASSGSLLMVTFPNGNSGVALRDGTARSPFEVQDVEAVSRLGGRQRGVEFQLKTASSSVSFSGILLDTVRSLREWDSWDQGRTRAARYTEFDYSVRHLPREVLVNLLREGIPLVELSRRTSPRLFYRRTENNQHLYIFRLTLGGHLYVVEMIFPLSYTVHWTPQGKIDIQAEGRQSLEWEMVVTTDFPPLTAIPRAELLRPEVLNSANHSPSLKREFDDLEFLAFQQFFAAGSHRFLQFFGRDTLIWLQMFAPLLTTQSYQTALQGVLDRVSPEGRVPSVEELDDQYGYELLEDFCSAARGIIEPHGLDRLYKSARVLGRFARGNSPARDLKYGVPDVDMMLLPAVADYLRREEIPLPEKIKFLQQKGSSGIQNIHAVLRNADWVIRTATSYTKKQQEGQSWPAGLVGANTEGDFANWRDVRYGLGYGLYPEDVNAHWIPDAVRALQEIITFLRDHSMWDGGRMDQIIETDQLHLLDFLRRQEAIAFLQELNTSWEGVRDHFLLHLSPQEIRARLDSYVRQLPPQEREWLLHQQLGEQIQFGHFLQQGGPIPLILQSGMTYSPVSLDRAGNPIPVIASDEILALLDTSIPTWRLVEILTPLMLPFPVGLWTPAGFVVASSALSNNPQLWQEISRSAYGGSVVYGWQMEFLKQGLFRQLMRLDLTDPQLRSVLYSAFTACCDATPPEMIGQELWSWDVDNDTHFHAVTFGQLPGHNDQSNPVQLWSISTTELLRPQVQDVALQQRIPLLNGGEFLDSLAQVQQHYPSPRERKTGAGLEEMQRPRIAIISMSLPPGGGGVNIVIANQVALAKVGGYPLTVLGGQVISMPPMMKANPPDDNAYTRAGMRLQIIRDLDLQGQIEREVREGTLDQRLFNDRVEGLMLRIERAISDAQVVLIHQYMTMPSNLLVVEAMGRLARKYQGQKRFVAWVHNVLPGKAQGWPMEVITQMDPRMEYITVSSDLRNQTLQLFGMSRWPWMMGVIKNSISAINFLDINPKVLDTYFSHRLYDAEYLLFYPARLVETKEVAGAIAAVARARQRGHDVRLVISTTGYEGKIPQEAQAYHQHLLELRDRLGLTENQVVIYLHEPSHEDLKSQKEIRDWFRLTDALMFPSQQETAGIPVKEGKINKLQIFHTDLQVLNLETEGYPHVVRFPARQHWESEVGYGGLIGDRLTGFLESTEGKTDISMGRAQKHELAQSFEGLLGLISSWLNLPPADKRLIRAGTRNFASTGLLVEDAIHEAVDAGYRAFQINFDSFGPSDINGDGIQKIRQAATGLRLTCRVANFPNLPLPQAEQLLREATVFAMKTGMQDISVPARGLDLERAQMIIRVANWAREEAAKRDVSLPNVLFSIENGWREEWGEWKIIPAEHLRDYFAGQPVGISLWVDSFQTWNPDGPIWYLDNVALKLNSAYIGEDFFQYPALFERARALLVEMQRRHWDGDFIGESIAPIPSRNDRESEQFKVGMLHRIIDEAFLPEDTSRSLRNGGELVGSPSMEGRTPVQGGLEELSALAELISMAEASSLEEGQAVVLDVSVLEEFPWLVPIIQQMDHFANHLILLGPSEVAQQLTRQKPTIQWVGGRSPDAVTSALRKIPNLTHISFLGGFNESYPVQVAGNVLRIPFSIQPVTIGSILKSFGVSSELAVQIATGLEEVLGLGHEA